MNHTFTVLVIDDDPGIRKLTRRIITPLGYQVRTAPDGQEGISIVQNETVHLVLLDLEMPVMNGPEFIRRLRDDRREIPIVVLTGHPNSDLMLEAFRFGPLTLIPKPIDKSMLLTAVTMSLEGVAIEKRRA